MDDKFVEEFQFENMIWKKKKLEIKQKNPKRLHLQVSSLTRRL